MKNCFFRLIRATCFSTLMSLAMPAMALGPHEVLVIANENSIDSVLVARSYMRMRSIPESNLVRLDIPQEYYATNNLISPEQFNQLIWKPTIGEVEKRGLTAQILAWIYSTDFPTRVSTTPNCSITGLTFARGIVPDSKVIESGSLVSPLFAGPENREKRPQETQSLDQQRNMLLDYMPLPSMMLGYTGKRGNTVDELLAALEKGVASDGFKPSGHFWFNVSDDVRSMCRHWQYEGAIEMLAKAGRSTVSTNAMPEGVTVAGLMMGERTVAPESATYEPGAYADHLTSFAGAFEVASQTKMSEWLRHGVTATSGTVSEPYALWPKFPNAYIFWHQVNGAALIEALYQSTRCPLQLLPIGDPLAKPWAPRPRVDIQAPESPISGIAEFKASTPGAGRGARYTWLLDGRAIGTGSRLLWDSRQHENGNHTIRAVIRLGSPMRHQGFQEVVVQVRNETE